MAVTFLCGFESAATLVDGITFSVSGFSTYSTTQARTGTRSIRCNPSSGASAYVTLGVSTPNYIHYGLYVASLPSLDRVVSGEILSGRMNVRLTSAGALAVYNNTTLIGTSSAAFASPGWHWVGVRQVTGTSVVFLQIDGVDEVTGTATVSAPSAVVGFSYAVSSAADAYIDDVIVDDAGFLAPSKVALLLPEVDGTSANWTNGTGGTTNLYDAVNNVPPAGLATETATSQIEHPGGATGQYNSQITSYTSAGVGASDTVLAVQMMIVWGEDSATGTKLLSYGSASNPNFAGESSVDVSSGDGSGATLNYAAAPPAPDYWNERRSAVVTSPSVTLGTRPQLYVNRPETASRVASVCFMGMYVAWTPSVGVTGNFTADAVIKATITPVGGKKADAVLFKNSGTKTFTADAIIKRTMPIAGASFTAAATIKATITPVGGKKADAVLRKTITPTFAANAVIRKPDQLGSFNANAVKRQTFTPTFTANADVKKTITPTFAANAIVKATLTPAGGITANAIIKANSGTKTFAAAAVLRRTYEPTFAANAVIRKPDNLGSFTANAIRGQTFTPTFVANADIFKTQSGAAQTFTVNAVIKATITPTTTANAVLFKNSGTKTFAADAIVRRTFEPTFTANADIKATVAGAKTADAIRKRTFYFGSGPDPR